MTLRKTFLTSVALCALSTAAFAEQQIFTERYELSIPDEADYHQAGDSHDIVVESLKENIAHIVNHAAALKRFPVNPDKVLPKIVFHQPIIHIDNAEVDIFVFTVDVPVPDIIRNILLKRWFSDDVYVESDLGYLRLHKEKGGKDSDVAIIISRATNPESLETIELDNIINSFSTL